jgi:hypothetical protein
MESSARRSRTPNTSRRDRGLWHDEAMMRPMLSSTRSALAGLMAVSVAGTADVGQFLATRSAMFTDAPGRAAGSVLGLVFWLALLLVAASRYLNGDQRRTRAATVGLAGLVAVGNVGLTLIHLKAGIGGWRPVLGGGLGVAALVLGLVSVGSSRQTDAATRRPPR